MSTEHEIEELQEAAEHGREQSKLAPVSLTMSILAVLVAVAALLSHRSHTEEVLLQNKATDQWGYYQAKNIRRHTMSQVDELLKVLPVKDTGAAEALLRKNEAAIEKSVGEQEEISKEAKATEAEVEIVMTWAKPCSKWDWSYVQSRYSLNVATTGLQELPLA
jgi:hypothetical protein